MLLALISNAFPFELLIELGISHFQTALTLIYDCLARTPDSLTESSSNTSHSFKVHIYFALSTFKLELAVHFQARLQIPTPFRIQLCLNVARFEL